jgi:hypothetical protein
MRAGLGPRFAVEAGLLIVVAVVAGVVLSLDTWLIVVVMAAAWGLLSVFEWAVARSSQAGDTPEVASSEAAPELPHVRVVPGGAAGAVLEHAPSGSKMTEHPEAEETSEAEAEPGARTAPAPREVVAAGKSERLEGEEEEAESQAPVEALKPKPAEPARLEPAAAAEEDREPQPSPAEVVFDPAEEPEPEPTPLAAELGSGPREWNLWDLERLARSRAGTDLLRDEERSFLLMYLREFADAGGVLPADFDDLVRDSFGDLLAPARSR